VASFEANWAFSTLVLQCYIYKVYRNSRRGKTVSGKCVEGTHATSWANLSPLVLSYPVNLQFLFAHDLPIAFEFDKREALYLFTREMF